MATRNNDYLSLINFKVKLQCQRLLFINQHDVGGGSNFFYEKKVSDDEALLWN